MAAMRGPRLHVGSTAWVAEERSCALQIAQSEVEEFSYSARNELDWLNEHMAGIFNENETNIAETFKTPGKLRGKTPRTARKADRSEARVPLADVFAATPNGSTNRFTTKINRIQSPKLKFKAARSSPAPARTRPVSPPKPPPAAQASQDSGYYGSQDVFSQNTYMDEGLTASQSVILDHPTTETTTAIPLKPSSSRTVHIESPEKTFETAKEEQTAQVAVGGATRTAGLAQLDEASQAHDARGDNATASVNAPLDQPSTSNLNTQNVPTSPIALVGEDDVEPAGPDSHLDEVRSPSDGSSPIRPLVRKSSLNFASLPAREPLGAGKGGRVSRTSHLDQHRTSYYSRPTGGKSLGTHAWRDTHEDEDHDEMDLDKDPVSQRSDDRANPALNHNKSYTQRLQDRIDVLGKSRANNTKPSKSIPDLVALQQVGAPSQPTETPKSPSPKKVEKTQTTPGAFPEDEDDWIDPPPTVQQTAELQSPRPALPKSYTADVMEGIHGSDTIGDIGFHPSPVGRNAGPSSPQQTASSGTKPSGWFGHGKSASVSALNQYADDQPQPLTKAATVSNAMGPAEEIGSPVSPPKSPSRSFRESPSKQVKNKLSSIIKFSKGLLASSAAISAEGKASVLSPSTSRLALHFAPSSESIIPKPSFESLRSKIDAHGADREKSPKKPLARRTRASVEREKEEKRREKEAKRQEEEMGKLEKAREKEREKARVFSKEQAKIAALEQQVEAKKDEEKAPAKEAPKPIRTSPRKAKEAQEQVQAPPDSDVDMLDAANAMPPPPSVPRSAGASQAQSTRTKDIKRPVKPIKETLTRAKQAPTVIRVNTGSQHSQYRPSSANVLVNGHESVSSSSSQPQQQSQQQPSSKASKATLQTKPSTQSLKGTAPVGRPKAADVAAKKKEQEEREAQRRRDAKAETERKRAAAQEEQRRQEQQRRQEAERQKQKDREQNTAQSEAKKNAQRQALIEKAKQTRAPPPAARPHPNGPPDFSAAPQDHASSVSQPARPPSRMNSGAHVPHDDANRPNPNASKAGVKRALGAEANEDTQGKRPPSRGGPSYQAKDSKRRRTSEGHDDHEAEVQSKIKNPPVRPSGGLKKVCRTDHAQVVKIEKLTAAQELPKKPMLQNGYSNAPQSATRDLFKATVAGQFASQAKTAHPLDMAQISKGAIPFAPNPNPSGNAHKTPARPGAPHGAKSAGKSVPRSSPRFQNGESIELPEIQTDDEDDEDDEAAGLSVAAWADSPDLRRALMRQETMDPSQIFGPPAPLNMEEVFNKSKDRFHKFRARTSSANWSGADRLTEDDIRKDMAARDKMRRDGGWSYDLSRDLAP